MTKLKYFLRDSSLDIFKPKHPISTQTDLKTSKTQIRMHKVFHPGKRVIVVSVVVVNLVLEMRTAMHM